MAFGKRIPVKSKVEQVVEKVEIKEIIVPNIVIQNKVLKFNKKAKIQSHTDFGLTNEQRIILFIKNKIKSSRRFNGWYITINTFNFAEKIGYNTDLIYLTDLVDKINKSKV